MILSLDSVICRLMEPKAGSPAPRAGKIAREIRAHAARHASPDFALKAILGARPQAPACLSGLMGHQRWVVHPPRRETLDPERTRLQEKLASALADLRKGVGAAKRMLLGAGRCELVEDGKGQFRSSPDTMPA